jgi:galactonate dehydratase
MSHHAERITRLTTFEVEELPNVVWVEVETDDGVTGLGETFLHGEAVAAYLHTTVAPYLLGASALEVNKHWLALFHQWGRGGMGVESRGASAVDIALWDALGRRYGLPLYQLMGGLTRESIPVYNTCAGPNYVRAAATPGDMMFGLGSEPGRFEDLATTQRDAGELARDLLSMDISAMKIWPFDVASLDRNGTWITDDQIAAAVRPLEQIRAAVGHDMEVAVELHAKWGLAPAMRIARALEPFAPMWIEDPMRLDNLGAFREFASATSAPIAVSERLGDRFAYGPLLDTGAVGVVMTDPVWVGGVTEARRVADMASFHQLPFTPHDCTGPVSLAVGVHLCLTAETAIFQEFVRAFYFGWYREVAAGLPPLEGGHMTATSAPGHGIQLHDDVRSRAKIRTSEIRSGDRVHVV